MSDSAPPVGVRAVATSGRRLELHDPTRDLACLSTIFLSAEEWEWTTRNPVPPYIRGRAKRGLVEGAPRTRYLSHDEEAAILEIASPKAVQAIMFAIDTGLRLEEQFSLLRSDINTATWTLTVRAEVAMSGKERPVPLLERSRLLVERILATPSDSPYIFMYVALQRAVRRADLKHTQWHDLRRTCGCRL